MFTIIGYLLVFGAVIGGFVVEGGPIAVPEPNNRISHHRRRRQRPFSRYTDETLGALANSLKKAIVGAGYSKS